jgi:hypothetical protein
MTSLRSLGKRLFLSFVAVGLTLVVLELACRIRAAIYENREAAAFRKLAHAKPPKAGADVGLGRMIRLSRHTKVVYELIPDLSVRLRGTRVSTDSNGFRRIRPEPREELSSVAILGLGDSFMFGWGVNDDQCYLAHLNTWLRKQDPHRGWNVLNMAVPGYNTVMQIELLKTKGLSFNPRLVIIHYVVNDLDLPNFIGKEDSMWTLKRFFLKETFSRKFSFRYNGLNRLVDVPFDVEAGRYRFQEDHIPAKYRDLVGLDAYLQAMHELKELGRQHGFEIIVLADLRPPDYVVDMCAAEGLTLVTTREAVHRHLLQQGFSRHDKSDLVLSATDSHPSVNGHRLLADALIQELESGNYLERLINNSAGVRPD